MKLFLLVVLAFVVALAGCTAEEEISHLKTQKGFCSNLKKELESLDAKETTWWLKREKELCEKQGFWK